MFEKISYCEERPVTGSKSRVSNNLIEVSTLEHPIKTKGEFCSKYKEIYSSPPILFDTTESFTESCKQSLYTALSKRLNCVKYNWR